WAVSFSPDGRFLASGSVNYTINIWEMPSGKLIKTLKGHTDSVWAISFSPDGRFLASGSSDKTIKLWDMPQGRFLTCLFDPAALEKGKEANQYTITNQYGKTITYTLPCGSPIPPGAICTCNCIPGTHYVAPSTPSTRRLPYTYCQCDKICVCIPVK
ncbi:MAG: NTPase, partial [Candidatus Scalindua rubra]